MKDYIVFIKNYFKYTCTSTKKLVYMILSASFYKGFYLLLPLVASFIIKYITTEEYTFVYFLVFLYAIVYLLYKCAEWVNYEVYTKSIENCYTDLQKRILNKVLLVDEFFSKKVSKANMASIVTSDVTKVGDMLDNISEFITTFFQIILVNIIVCFYNIYLGIAFFIYTFVYIKICMYADKMKNVYHRKVVKDDDSYSGLLYQMTSGLQEIKSFNMIDKMKRKLKSIQRTFTKHYHLKRGYMTLLENDVNYLTVYFRVILYLLLLLCMIKGLFGVDVLVLVISYHEYLEKYLYDFLTGATQMREESASLERINMVLNYKIDKQQLLDFGPLNHDDIDGVVEFKNVSFLPANKKVLRNISFKATPGKVLGIVGQSGSGKTTIFNLLLRLYKPNKGKILIDGMDSNLYSKEVYANNVTIANQRPFIFNMSIRENLSFVDKDINRQIEACKKVGIHDFITSLKDGYNTVLRANGSNISGGQKQLISIARTLLSDAEIILFDDVSTSLDPDTAKMLPRLLKELKKDHTVIMITKKKELMKECDEILVLEEGRITARGTHQQLLKTSSEYQNINAYRSRSNENNKEVFE